MKVQHWDVTFEKLSKPKVGIAVSNTAKMAPMPPIVMIRINLRCYSIGKLAHNLNNINANSDAYGTLRKLPTNIGRERTAST